MTAILLCGDDIHETELRALARALGERAGLDAVDVAPLGAVGAALGRLTTQGAQKVVCLPAAVSGGGAFKATLPAEINAFAEANPEIDVVLGRALDVDPRVLKAAEARITEALGTGALEEDLSDTLLFVVGPGGPDTDANADIAKIARLVWEGLGFGWAEVCFAAETFPTVNQSLARAARLGFGRAIILPCALGAGSMTAAIEQALADEADGAKVSAAGPLGAHGSILDIFMERIAQAVEGGQANAMNCQLCGYREQVLGLENGHGHDHSHDHGHDHHHAPESND